MESADPEKGYATYYAMSAVEYNIFLNKQIGVMENILLTRMLMAENVMNGSYPVQSEISNVEESISKAGGIKDEVTVTMPATGYETDRQNALDLIEEARVALVDYLDTLNNGGIKDIESHITQMQACYTALGGEANSYYQ